MTIADGFRFGIGFVCALGCSVVVILAVAMIGGVIEWMWG